MVDDALVQEVLSKFGELENADTLTALLRRRPDLLLPAVVQKLTDAVRQHLRINVEESLKIAETALAIAQELCDAQSLGCAFRAKANALWFKGNCSAAVELFQIAVTHFEQAGKPEEIGRTLSSCIQSLALLGEYDRAFEAAARAREIFLRLDDRWRLARLELNVANILHRQDRFGEALATYQRAYEELLPYKDSEGLGVALHNIAVCLIMLNDFDRALACYHDARQLCEQNGMPLLAVQADYNIAYLYFLRGDYDKAIESLSVTRDLCRRNGDSYHAALCDLDEAEIYVELNLTEEAVRMAGEAGQQFRKLGMAFEEGRAVANLAIATHQQNDSGRALELFAQAKTIFARENNKAWLALIDLYQALVLFENGTFDEAERLCTEALNFFDQSGLDRRAVLCHLLLTRTSLETGRLHGARENCERAMQKVASLEAPLLEYQTHLLLGHIERASGTLGSAYESYSRARRELETLRSSLQGEELKIAFLKNKIDVYESLVQLCLRDGSSRAREEAFDYMEQAKSRSLVELLFGRAGQAAWRVIDEQQGDRLRELRRELNWYYHRIEIEQTRPEGISVQRIQQLQADVRLREDELLRAVRRSTVGREPAGALQAAGAMAIEQIRAALHPEVTVVEYFQLGPQFVAAVLTREELTIVPLAASCQVISSLRMLQFHLSKFRQKGSRRLTFEAEVLAATENRLQELYRDLVAPLAPVLKGGHVLVIPHGVLHYVPFHALSDKKEHLIDHFTISYAPSASIYAMCQRRRANASGPALLFGVQDKNAPHIRHEIRSVAAMVPEAQVYLGSCATAEVLRSAGSTSRMIHIATHGLFRRDNPMFSSVRLADTYLSLYDLYQLRLPVQLLTLSGCGTGLNVIAAGDELLGLARGLLCAGAQSLVLSLWDVHDRATAEFMTSFYSHLQRQEKRLALRAAMLEIRERYPHPYHWAPFVLVGTAFAAEE